MTAELDHPTVQMTLAEKLEKLHQASGASSYAAFAELIDVNVTTLRRVGRSGEGSDRVLKRIASRFQGLSPEDLVNPERPLPENLRLTPGALIGPSDDITPHQGKQLRRYLKSKGIKDSHLADKMGVTRVQMHYYLKSQKFERETRDRILAALGVPASAVFVDEMLLERQANVRPQVSLVAVMMIRPQDRTIDLDRLDDAMRNFSPVISAHRSFYVSPTLLETSPDDLAYSVAIQISQNDRLAPQLVPGAIVLARLIEKADWWSASSATVALLINGRLQVRRLLRNEIRSAHRLEVGSFDPEQGSSQFVHEQDIQAVFCITHILLSPA